MQPTLETSRLILRPFTRADAPAVRVLAGDPDIASTTLNIPHPYEEGMAEAWIASHEEQFERGVLAAYAITARDGALLLGAVGLAIQPAHARAELGYWVGKPYWGCGYCTEAARAVLAYAFGPLRLNRVHACHFVRNPASGRVMRKLGMSFEGRQRQHVRKWGHFEDVDNYAILADEFAG